MDFKSAALHVLGDSTFYRPNQGISLEEMILPIYRMAAGPAPTPVGAEISRKSERDLASWMGQLDELDAEAATPQIRQALQTLMEEGLASFSEEKWSLTMAGILPSVEVRDRFTDKNVTTLWVERTVDEAYLRRIATALSFRCSRSVQFGELMDLVMHYFTGVLRRDAFRKRISTGRNITPSDVVHWTYKAALSIFRDQGRDAHTRAFKGALTEKDLKDPSLEHDVAGRSSTAGGTAVFLVEEGVNVSSSVGRVSPPLLDAVGGNLEQEILHQQAWKQGMARVQSVLRRSKIGDVERAARILAALGEGASCADIAEQEGVTRTRIHTLVNTYQKVLTQQRDLSQLAMRIFAYLRDNPASTLEDMESPLNPDPHASDGGLGEPIPQQLIADLVAAGRLRQHKQCYYLTPKGEEALDAGEYFGVDLELYRPPIRSTGGQSFV